MYYLSVRDFMRIAANVLYIIQSKHLQIKTVLVKVLEMYLETQLLTHSISHTHEHPDIPR